MPRKQSQSPWSRSLQTAIWRREWSKLYALVEAELPAQAAERISNPPAFTDPDEARFDIEVILLSWALPDFVAYMEALNRWLGKSAFLKPDTPYPLVGALARRPEVATSRTSNPVERIADSSAPTQSRWLCGRRNTTAHGDGSSRGSLP